MKNETNKRYEIVKSYGHGGASETESKARAKAIAKRYAERTGEPAYVCDWAEGGKIIFEAI